jgi:plasmid stabilization system protein ParE
MRLEYSAQAEGDIDEIEAWIIAEGSPLNALRYIDRLGGDRRAR